MDEDWGGRGLENGRKCRSERKDGWKNEKKFERVNGRKDKKKGKRLKTETDSQWPGWRN